MYRSAIFCAVLLVIAGDSTSAEDSPSFKPLILPDSIRFVQVFSSDRQVGTMLFDNFLTATEIGKSAVPSRAMKEFTYALHPLVKKESAVKQWIRGFVSTSQGGSAFVVVHTGGRTTLVDLKSAVEAIKSGKGKARSSTYDQAKILAKEQGLCPTEPKRIGDFGEFLVEVESVARPDKPLQSTIVLFVDRVANDEGSQGMLTIDSIDFEVSELAAGGK